MSDPSKMPAEGHRNESVLGPFTVRDLTLLGGVLITFVGSLLPLVERNVMANLWNAQNIFFLCIGFLVPAAAAALFVWRRLEPRRALRVGSLSVDQFASVAAVLCCSYYFVFTVMTFTPGAVVGLLGGIALVAATTAARLVPSFAGDFDGRAATPAHVVARDAAQPVPRTHSPSAAAGHGAGASAGQTSGAVAHGAVPAVAAGAGAAAAGAGGMWARPSDARQPEAHQSEARPSEHGAGHAVPTADDVAAADARVAPGSEQDAARFRPAAAAAPENSEKSENTEKTEDGGDRFVGVGGSFAPSSDDKPSSHASAASEDSGAEDSGAVQTANRGAGERTVPSPTDIVEREVDGGTYAQADGEAYGAPEPEPATVGGAGIVPPTAAFPAQTPSAAASEEADRPVAEGSAEATPTPSEDAEPAPAGAVVHHEDIEATSNLDEPVQYEAFWFAVSQPRTAVDPMTGAALFDLEPGQWILALQDRGNEFVVQSTDGRVGVLRELAGIERG